MAFGSATAGAVEWDGRRLAADSSDRLPLFGISCPSAELCVSVGGGNTIGSSTNPTGNASAWKVVYAGDGPYPGSPNQRQIRGVSCPSPQLCVAVTFEGLIYTATNPTGDATDWQVTDIDGDGPNTHFYGISCPSPSFCAASAGEAKIVTSTNPTGGAGAWTTTQLRGPLELRGISCASAALCVAVGDNGDNIRPEIGDQAVIASSANPLAGEWSVAPLPGRQSAYGVSCPSAQLCVSGDTLGNLLVATDPTGGSGAWREIDGGGSVQITDVDCASPSLCLAVDNNGDVLTSTDPDGGAGDWTFLNIVPFPFVDETQLNAFWGASCPSRNFCAISAMAGTIFTSTDPFEASAPVPVAKGGKKKGKKGKRRVKRPRVMIASGPPPGVEITTRKVTVRFRFYARNHAFARGYLCKLDQRPTKRCRSPKPYRVGLGRHVFRVRAIGYSGLRGRIETRRFKVCRPTEYGNCVRNLPAAR
ncbi:MAG TPA: hypothetical protein VFU11_02970 [Solirubrobacterales bacterium]|nr:hypothetical protein [Solirubrobacterales bacterium]